MKKNFRYKCLSCSKIFYRSLNNNLSIHNCGGKVIRDFSTYTFKPLTKDQKQFIKENYQTMIYLDIAKALDTTETRVANHIRKSGLRLTPEEFERRKSIGKFKPGQISWNKGLSLPNVPNSGQFEKGQLPANTLSDGVITWRKRKNRKNADYFWIRIALGKWKQLHVYKWEKKYGPVPKGMILIFKDKDHRNVKLNNLKLITRAEHLQRNKPADLYKRDLINSNRYIAARLKILGKENQNKFISDYPELIEAKRQQLKLGRVLNETKRQNFQHAK